MSFSGTFLIKRKSRWANRFVHLDADNKVLSYKDSERDLATKFFVDLTSFTLKKGFTDKAKTNLYV